MAWEKGKKKDDSKAVEPSPMPVETPEVSKPLPPDSGNVLNQPPHSAGT